MLKILVIALLFTLPARGEDGPIDKAIPKTAKEAKAKSKSGGKQIGGAFKSLGRGVKKIFTGEETKGEFKEAAKGAGEGAANLGTGVLGFGRAAGRGVKKAVSDEPEKKNED